MLLSKLNYLILSYFIMVLRCTSVIIILLLNLQRKRNQGDLKFCLLIVLILITDISLLTKNSLILLGNRGETI